VILPTESLDLPVHSAAPPPEPPIVVDLDHCLLLTDSLDESLASSIAANPRAVAAALFALPRGRLAVKSALAARAPDNAETLPLRAPLVDWLRVQAEAGREIHLCTAAHQTIADAVARRLGFIESAIGSSTSNLKGREKGQYLARRFPAGFVYAGDSRSDLDVWRLASAIVLVNTSAATAAAARKLGPPVIAEFEAEQAGLNDWIQAVRAHHWSKNVLVFVPMVLGQSWREPAAIFHTLLAFILLLVLTSSTYLLNDIADVQSDRQHWSKHRRPIASGRIPIRTALGAGVAGVVFVLLVGIIVSPALFASLAAYLALTLGYSLWLRRVPLLDLLVIALLFGMRLVIGVAVLNQAFSGYLLSFALFFFFSLATAKRHTEILRSGPEGGASLAGRGYEPADAELTLVLGVASGLGSIIVLILYLMEDAFLRVPYTNPGWLWAEPLLVAVWLGRIWLLSHRGQMQDDPVSFAVRDKTTWGIAAGVAVAYLLAL
jgi:4-hydroxybenzoate polyprenyltransferase/phosphoserine phosphatase